MSVGIAIAAGLVVLAVFFAIDLWLDRLRGRMLFKLMDRLPPHLPWRRYRCRSDPEKYARFRRKRGGR